MDFKEIKPVNPKGNQSWIFIGRTMLKLKLQYFGLLMWRVDSLEKTLMLGKIEGRRRRGRQRMRWLIDISDSMDRVWASSRRWLRTGKPGVLQSMVLQRVGHDGATEQQQRGSPHMHRHMLGLGAGILSNYTIKADFKRTLISNVHWWMDEKKVLSI